MATNIEILNDYEKNGKTYTGSFPLFISTVVCETSTEEDQEDLLSLIQEDDTIVTNNINRNVTIIFPEWTGWELYNVPPAYGETLYPPWNVWTLSSSQI